VRWREKQNKIGNFF